MGWNSRFGVKGLFYGRRENGKFLDGCGDGTAVSSILLHPKHPVRGYNRTI